MYHKKLMFVCAIVLILSMALAACQPVVQTVEVVKTQEVEVVKTQLVEQTQIVEVEKQAFTTPHPILSDLRVRQAMAYCTDKLELIKSVYPLLKEEEQKSLVMNTMIPSVQWAYAGDENITVYPFDPEKGKALLEEAGWTLADGANFRTNANGDELTFKFSTTNATFRQTWAAVWEAQMKNCGIGVLRFHVPSSWWFGDTTGLARRDFEIGAYAWVGEADPKGQTLWACDQIPMPTNAWEGQNYMGWCNETADKAIKVATNSIDMAERTEAYKVVQQEYTKDVPAIPLFNRTETFAVNPELTGFDPKPGYQYYNWNIDQWEIPGKDTIVFGFTQEPASLFTLVEDAWVAVLVMVMVDAYQYTSEDYTFAPYTQKALPSLDNGLATLTAVDVKDGDKVVNAGGDPVDLKAGDLIKDDTGAEVEYKGGGAKMMQLTATYEFLDGLTFSDGEPVKQEDLELGYKIFCDRESGATSYITCDWIQDVKFNGLSYTITYKPGVQDSLYFLAPFTWYPAHQVLADGRKLGDVPAKEWATLPEIAETPMGAGPYVIKEWVKGEKIVLEANPYWVKGEPKTKNVVVAFITPENAEAQLLGGQVDILGSESFSGITETIANAEAEGKVKTYVIPGGTWEHIDFNLFIR